WDASGFPLLSSANRQDYDEATVSPALGRAARVAPVRPGDLPRQRRPQACPCGLSGSRTAVERVEHALALGFRNPRAVVADGYFGAVPGARDAHFDRRSAVAFCVLQQIAQHPTQQARIAMN